MKTETNIENEIEQKRKKKKIIYKLQKKKRLEGRANKIS